MDGYAVRSPEVLGANPDEPAVLEVVGSVHAGSPSVPAVGPGQAARIMTGAPLPQGADCVIRVEHTDREETPGTVRVLDDHDAGRNVRPGGQDMRAGDLLLEAGTSLSPGGLSVAAAAGEPTLRVHVPPRCAVLSTGDELATARDFDAVIRGEAVPESNGALLYAACLEAGGQPRPPALARDRPDDIRRHVEDALDADVLVLSGGASMGEADHVKRVLDGMAFQLSFWRVAQRPGNPLAFGMLPRQDRPPLPVFSLPGNPASAFVTFEVFVRPFVRRSGGHARVHRRVVSYRALDALRGTGRLTHFLRVRVETTDRGAGVRLTGPQGSGLVRSLGEADGLAVVPRGREVIEPGDSVDVILLSGGDSAELGFEDTVV